MSTLDEQKAEIPATVTMKEDPETRIAIKQEAVTAESLENTVANQNGTNGKEVGTIDLTNPIKTEGEASSSENSFLPRSLQLTPTSSAAISSPITPFAPNLGSLSSQLTPEEQTAAYKKANILALSALAKRGGPNTKDLFAVQQKLQEFLTSLITLAGQKGPQLKVTVQMLVQNLVTGQISEEEFATRIESDLHSQHQPSLLPFLKNSVPHLKTRLQLQQVIMKELIQRALTEKKAGGGAGGGATSGTATATTNPPPASSSSSAPTASSSSETSPLVQAPPTTSASVTPPPPPAATQGGVTAVRVGTVKNSSTKPTTVPGSNVHLQLASQGVGLSRAALEQLNQQLPQVLRDKIAKLPPEQQKFVYTHHLAKLKEQQLKQQQQQVKEKHQQQVREQQIPLVLAKPGAAALRNTTITLGGGGAAQDTKKPSFATMKVIPSSASAGGMSSSSSAPGLSAASAVQAGKKKGKSKESSGTHEAEEEEEVGMDLLDEVGVNLQEESAQFLPSGHVDTHAPRSCKDVVFLNLPALRRRVETIMRANGMQEVGGEEVLVQLSHATQERMRDVVEKLTEISQHRTQTLKDNSSYRVFSEVRSQLRVLEAIDRIIGKRKQDKEHEQMLRAAKSRSKGADPEKTAKIREEAKQLQQDEAARIRNERANLTALAAIGRKRPLPPSHSSEDAAGGGASSSAGPSDSVGNAATSSLFASLGSTRAPKRHVTSRDMMFYMEQERETRKSLALYKTMLK